MVVPAQAGIHTRRGCHETRALPFLMLIATLRRRLWVPVSAGTTSLMTLHVRRRSMRRLKPLFRQQPHCGFGVHRLAEGEALRVFAAELI